MAKKKDSFGDSPIGSGGRFAECVRQMRKRPSVYDPEGLCASIGRKKYGKRRFAKMGAKGKRNPPTTSRVAIEHVRRAMASLDEAFQHVRRADREAHGSDREQLKRLEDLTWGAYMASIGLYTGMAHQDRPRRNPLTDAEHMRTKKHTMELTDRMERVAMHEGNLGREDLADHWREMAQYVSGAGWAHMRASQGIPFPEPGYAATSGLEGAECCLLYTSPSPRD